MTNGWVKIHRSLSDHPAFRSAAERWAFIELIARAAHKPATVRYRDLAINLERGQVVVSLRDLTAHIGEWDLSATRRFLGRLEKHDMIRRKADTGVTVITICNYCKFQDALPKSDTVPTHQTTHQTTQARPKTDTPNDTGVTVLTHCNHEENHGVSAESDTPNDTGPAQNRHTKRHTKRHIIEEEYKNSVSIETDAAAHTLKTVDPKKLAYDAGKALLGLYGISGGKAGALITKWLRSCAPSRLLAIIADAGQAERHEIVAYLEAAVRASGTTHGGRPADPAVKVDKARVALVERWAGPVLDAVGKDQALRIDWETVTEAELEKIVAERGKRKTGGSRNAGMPL